MKKVILTLVLLAFTTSNAQTIQKLVDELSDKVYYLSKDAPIFSDNNKDGFVIRPSIKENSSGSLHMSTLIVSSYGSDWSCVEGNSMIILYTDGTKDNIVSWNKFNCKGTSYFTLKNKTLTNFLTKEIDKVRLTNGRTHSNYTFKSPDPSYYIKLGEDMKNNNYEIITE